MRLQRLGQRDGVSAQVDRQHSHNAVVAQPPQVENLVLTVGNLVATLVSVEVPQRPVLELLDLHSAWVQRPQLADGTNGTRPDLGVGVAVQQTVSGQHLPEFKRGLPAVGLLCQQPVQRQIPGTFLAALG